MGQRPEICQLKVTLADSEPEVWRQILVSCQVTLPELHGILQRAMGWQNQHDYRFRLSLGANQPDCDLEQSLATVLQFAGEQPVYYTYDLQAGWLHRLEVKAVDQSTADGFTTPVCIAGAAACPPEGAGGVWGYDELLGRLDDPEDPDYMSLIEDYSDFDPEAFDLAVVNARL